MLCIIALLLLSNPPLSEFFRNLLEGRNEWDHAMEAWVKVHRDELLLSWERCQRGGHPYRIGATGE